MIRARGVSKRYGNRPALADVDLDVPDGSVFGLVGRNGAGKTTLLSVLAGLRRADGGSIEIDAAHRERAVLPDAPRFERWLTAREVVTLAARLSDTEPAGSVARVLGEAGLADDADRPVGGFSRGMLQRLGIAATLVGSPRLVLLDEPAAALDPAGRREVLDLIDRLRGTSTIVFSSHILGDVQAVCDRVAILDEGRLRFEGPVADLLAGAADPAYLVRVRKGAERVRPVLEAAGWVRSVTEPAPGVLRVEAVSAGDAERRLVPTLATIGVAIVAIEPEPVTLERVFLEITR